MQMRMLVCISFQFTLYLRIVHDSDDCKPLMCHCMSAAVLLCFDYVNAGTIWPTVANKPLKLQCFHSQCDRIQHRTVNS